MDETSPNYTKIMSYIDRNPAGVLSTVGEDGPHGAVVYFITASHGTLCFVTKNQTKKYANVINQPSVCMTFFNEKESTTLQATGHAFVADEKQGLKEIVMEKITKAHATTAGWLPPATKIRDGAFVVIGIELKSARLADYGSIDVSGPTFIELM